MNISAQAVRFVTKNTAFVDPTQKYETMNI